MTTVTNKRKVLFEEIKASPDYDYFENPIENYPCSLCSGSRGNIQRSGIQMVMYEKHDIFERVEEYAVCEDCTIKIVSERAEEIIRMAGCGNNNNRGVKEREAVEGSPYR